MFQSWCFVCSVFVPTPTPVHMAAACTCRWLQINNVTWWYKRLLPQFLNFSPLPPFCVLPKLFAAGVCQAILEMLDSTVRLWLDMPHSTRNMAAFLWHQFIYSLRWSKQKFSFLFYCTYAVFMKLKCAEMFIFKLISWLWFISGLRYVVDDNVKEYLNGKICIWMCVCFL